MAEAEYISKEAALACFSDWIDRYGHEHSADEITEYQRIEDLPVADVVEVVRCKDCRENDKTGYETADFGYCRCLNREVQDCFYCAHGERRADNG